MKSVRTLTIACLGLFPLAASAQDDPDEVDPQALLKKYGSPGKEHKVLKSWVGKWETANTFWMAAGAPPIKSSGEANFRLIMGGRYLTEQFKSESEEMGKFSGQGTFGFDRVSKEFIHSWIDSMSTGMMVSRGKLSEDGKTIVMETTQTDIFTMQKMKLRIVNHIGEKDRRKMEMFATYPDKEPFKNMEIIYERVAKKKKVKKPKGQKKPKKQGQPEREPEPEPDPAPAPATEG